MNIRKTAAVFAAVLFAASGVQAQETPTLEEM